VLPGKEKPPMFYKSHRDGYKPALPGIKLKTLVYGDKTNLTEFRLEKGSQLPPMLTRESKRVI
jgi:hypothetical protein